MLRHQSNAELGAYAGRATTEAEAPAGNTSDIIVGGNQENPGLAVEQLVLVPSLAEPGRGGVASPLELADGGWVDVQTIQEREILLLNWPKQHLRCHGRRIARTRGLDSRECAPSECAIVSP